MSDKNDKTTRPKTGQRIAKVMARAGLASRREAEAWIAAGRVSVNGKVIATPAVNIGLRDTVMVDGKPLPKRERTRLFLFNKPRGLVTTTSDPGGRPTVFGALPKDLPRLISIGRLDYNTEGLLLFTNDGGLARVLEHPQTGWLRLYRVRAHGNVTQTQLDALRDGISIEGIHYGPIEATLERSKGANVWLTFAIREGKNREVRNVLSHLGLEVNRLIRTSYGPFKLDELAEGAIEEVPTRKLREQLGKKIIDISDVDFDAPLQERAPRVQVGSHQPGRPSFEGRSHRPHQDQAFEDRSHRPPRDKTFEGRSHRPPRDKAFEGRPHRPPRDKSFEGRSSEGRGSSSSGQTWTKRPPRDAGAQRQRSPEDDRLRNRAPQDQGAPPRGPRPWRGRGRERPVGDPKLGKDTPRKTTAGLVTDRKGRNVPFVRTRSEAPPEEPRRPEPRGRERGKVRDRRQGPRPSRPRPPRDEH